MRKVSDVITGSDTFPVKSDRTMRSNALMYCCRSEKHIGHSQRAIEVARRMSEWFDVTILVDDEGSLIVDVWASTSQVNP